MSQQGPILVVSTAERPPFASALDEAEVFPIIESAWVDASRALEQLQPAAVLAAMTDAVEYRFEALAKQIAARQPYLPLIAIDPRHRCPRERRSFLAKRKQFPSSDRAAARRAAYPDIARHGTAPA
jgi:hypothetical protein